jgi:hypothetical protein
MCWQYRTISAVYSMVGGALKAAGRASESPLDYFQVLCLGNRCAWWWHEQPDKDWGIGWIVFHEVGNVFMGWVMCSWSG